MHQRMVRAAGSLLSVVAIALIVVSSVQAAVFAPRQNGIVAPEGVRVEVRRVDRRKVYYVLPAQDRLTPQPLLLLLPYESGSATQMANFVYAGEHAARGQRFAIPESSFGRWNNGVPGSGKPGKDLAFLADVVQDAITSVNTDPARVAVAGFSSGGFMADLFACTHSHLVMGVGIVGASQLKPERIDCTTKPGTRALFFHGTQDDTVHYYGTTYSMSAGDTLAFWQRLLGCSGYPMSRVLPASEDRTQVVYSAIPSCGAALYTIEGGGHNWPGGEQGPVDLLGHRSTDNIDATQALWEWFFGG